MEIKELNENEVKSTYKNHLKKDFPRSERRGLKNILNIIADGHYAAYGLFDGDSLCGYAFFVKTGNDYLLDYFAAVSGKRGQGIGTEFLRMLKEKLRDANSIMLESEAPDETVSAEDNSVRERRISFYLRSGFTDSGARACTFGVNYVLMSFSPDTDLSAEEIKELYLRHYKAMLPEVILKKAVRIIE